MRLLHAVALLGVLLAACSAPVESLNPSPSATAIANPSPAPTVTPSPTTTPLPSAASGGIEVFATGQLHGTYAWVVEEFGAPDRVTESLYAVPLDGLAPKLVVRRVRPRTAVTLGGYTTSTIVVDRQITRDGTRLVLEQAPLGVAAHDGLVIVDLAAGTIREIARGDRRDDVMPAWSPDGTRVAYARRNPGATPTTADDGLWIIGADDSAARQLQPPAQFAQLTYVFGWTADGRGVAFGLAFEGLGYSVIDAATGTVTGWPGAVFGLAPASWRTKSPQLAIAFSEGDKGGTQRIDVSDGVGKPARTIVHEPSVGQSDPLFLNARWSPIGDEILYIRSSRESKVVRVGAAGSGPTDVGVQGQPFRAEWLPDGRIAVITVANGVGAAVQVIDGAKQSAIFSFPGGASFTDLAIRTYP